MNPVTHVRCITCPGISRMFTGGKVYPVVGTGNLGLSVEIIDDLGHVRCMGKDTLRFIVAHGGMDSPIYAHFEVVDDLKQQAEEWLEAMLDNLSEAEATPSTALVQGYIDFFASQHPNPDRARNELIRAINADCGIYVFTSPDDGKPCVSTGTKIRQMGATLNQVDARLLY